MTSNDARPSGCAEYTPFEKELVNAMRDFANSTDSPDFAPATIMRGGARRRTRSLVTAGIAAALILADGGTAFAVTGGSGLNTGYKAPATSHLKTGATPTACAEPVTGQAPATAHKIVTGAASTTGTGTVPTTAHKIGTGTASTTGTGTAPAACTEPAAGQVPATGYKPVNH